jgi:hypothetical protein
MSNTKSYEFDDTKMQVQSKTILELQNDIKEYQRKERAYLVQLHLKDKELRQLELFRNDLLKKNKSDIYLDPVMLNEFKNLKNILKEKEEYLQSRDEELNSLKTNQNEYIFILNLVLCLKK